MRFLLRRLRPVGRRLTHHVQRLRQSLDSLGQRLREGVALAISQTVAAAAHAAARTVLDEPSAYPTMPYPLRAPPPARSLWGERPYSAWHEDLDDPLPEEDDTLDQAGQAAQEAPASTRLPHAVAAGLQAAAWWLRRQAGRCSLLVASAVGVLAALGAYAGGSVAVAGVGLAGAALSLLSLAQATQAGAGLLAGLSTE